MIAEIVGATVLLGAAVSGWIMAFRARGESNRAADRARLAEAHREAMDRELDLAMANEATARSEFKASETAFVMLRTENARLQKQMGDLLAKLEAANVPVGDVAVDFLLDGLYAHKASPRAGEDRGAPDPGTDPEPVSDVSSDPPRPATEKP